jgi:hypothetical protein
VRAFDDLSVDFNVPSGSPLFTIPDMKPGDPSYTRTITVRNSGQVRRMISVRGIRTGGTTMLPNIEHVLEIIISSGGIDIYGGSSPTGAKTVEQFFTDSFSATGILLGIINPSQSLPYTIRIYFPADSGNEYQAKSVVFTLAFGTIVGNTVVINELYYQVDNNHGLDSPKERNDKTKAAINNEWLELYNPTDHDINIKNWTLTDNSGNISTIHPNKIIKSESFIVISKDASTWKYWNIHPKSDKIELGNQLGDGLDNNGDRIILKDNSGKEVDRMSWGTDISGFTPQAPNPKIIVIGSSTERIVPGIDTDAATDWTNLFPPTPGI